MNFLNKNSDLRPKDFGLLSDDAHFDKTVDLFNVIQNEKKSGFGWRIIRALQNMLGIHGKVKDGQEMTKFIRKYPLE